VYDYLITCWSYRQELCGPVFRDMV